MESNDVHVLFWLLEELRDGSIDERVADAMKPVFPETFFFGNSHINCIGSDGLGDWSMKSRVIIGNVFGRGQY
jgi:hypothetical protein